MDEKIPRIARKQFLMIPMPIESLIIPEIKDTRKKVVRRFRRKFDSLEGLVAIVGVGNLLPL